MKYVLYNIIFFVSEIGIEKKKIAISSGYSFEKTFAFVFCFYQKCINKNALKQEMSTSYSA